jgi:hypothetical protein
MPVEYGLDRSDREQICEEDLSGVAGEDGDDRGGNPVCSFCGKSQDEVRKLIAGPTVYICDECIDL